MEVKDHLHCENCGKHLEGILVYHFSEIPKVFCSYECFNEYKTCDGRDDCYFSKDSSESYLKED